MLSSSEATKSAEKAPKGGETPHSEKKTIHLCAKKSDLSTKKSHVSNKTMDIFDTTLVTTAQNAAPMIGLTHVFSPSARSPLRFPAIALPALRLFPFGVIQERFRPNEFHQTRIFP